MKKRVEVLISLVCIAAMLAACSTPSAKNGETIKPTSKGSVVSNHVNDDPSNANIASQSQKEDTDIIATDMSDMWSNLSGKFGVQIGDCVFYVGEKVSDFIESIEKSKYSWEYDYNPDFKPFESSNKAELHFKYKNYDLMIRLKDPYDASLSKTIKQGDCIIRYLVLHINKENEASEKYLKAVKFFNKDLSGILGPQSSFDSMVSSIENQFAGTGAEITEEQTNTEGKVHVKYSFDIPIEAYSETGLGIVELYFSRGIKDKTAKLNYFTLQVANKFNGGRD